MPTRILRDWTDSQRLERVSAEAERLFVRLIMKADDFGRFHADPRLVSAACLPLVRQMTDKTILSHLKELADAELIMVYSVNGRNYLQINNFNQRTRSQSSRFPASDGQTSVTCQTNDGQLTARDGDGDGDVFGDVVGDGNGANAPAGSFEDLAEDLRDVPDLEKTWNEWREYRREKRMKLTKTSCRLQMDMLRKNKAEAVAMLNQSMMMDWRGVFPLKDAARKALADKRLTQADLI